MVSIARQLARFIADSGWDALPANVVETTKLAIADTLGSALAGDAMPTVQVVRQMVKDTGGKPEATLWGDGGMKVPAAQAAYANAVLADVLGIDESNVATIAHVCGTTVPAALAMAERLEASDRELILAVALGYEAAGRIGKSIMPDYMHVRGFHNSVVTIFGAAVAAAKIADLSEEEMTHTIALAATSAGGLAGSRKSTAREYHAGNSAMLGVNAALAASRGYRGLETVLEDSEGYCRAFSAAGHPGAVISKLGERWEIATEFAPKLMPSSHGIHTVVEATLGAIQGSEVDAADVVGITAKVPKWKKGYAVYKPRDVATASHSIPYFVATALLRKKVDWSDLELTSILDRTGWRIQEMVSIEEDPSWGAYDYPGGATVVISTRDGRMLTSTVNHALGTPQRGISWEQIVAKYSELATKSGMPKKQIIGGLRLMRGMEKVRNAAEIIPYITLR